MFQIQMDNFTVPFVLQCYFDQKPMKTILAIIQQMIIFTQTALYVGDGDLYVR